MCESALKGRSTSVQAPVSGLKDYTGSQARNYKDVRTSIQYSLTEVKKKEHLVSTGTPSFLPEVVGTDMFH
jgi:hypothetical protein